MSLRTLNTNYLRAGGYLSLAAVVNGQVQGFVDVGDAVDITVSRTVETVTVRESRSGSFNVAQTLEQSVTYSVAAALKHISIENLALAMACDVERRTVSATQVTGEIWYGAADGVSYFPGLTKTAADGIKKLTSVDSVAISASARANSTAYTVGTIVTNSGTAYVYTVAGTSASSAPSFPTAGGTVSDGTATLKHLGPVALVADADFKVQLDPAEVQILDGGDYATTLSRMPSGYVPNLVASYTPVATTQMKLKNRTTAVQYFARFAGRSKSSNNPASWTARYCDLSGNVESSWISSDAELTLPITLTPSSPDGDLPVQMRANDTDWFWT